VASITAPFPGWKREILGAFSNRRFYPIFRPALTYTPGKKPATLIGHKGTVWSAQFSSDNARIVTASDDQTVRVWDVVTGKMLTTLSENRTNASFL